ncbi:2'-5' RNA ligase family protein [Geitlerinema splendidum]|nr:2'-5' RNA ligase family protein [Geitlerinema splendidum]
MDSLKRFFIALLPPEPLQEEIRAIQEDFRDRYHSQGALKSPPHITLQPPFRWDWGDREVLENALVTFAANVIPVPIILDGFGAFPPRVIYVNVQKTPQLLLIQQNLMVYLKATLGIVDEKSESRPFAPHMTVAFRDLSKPNFKAAWPEFQSRALHHEFMVPHLTLLLHDGQRWHVQTQFNFALVEGDRSS